MDEDQQRYEHTRARVQALKWFYIHAVIYVLVSIMLVVIDLLTPDGYWFYWPLVGWGAGLGLHALIVFRFGGTLGRDWEERKIREMLAKDDRREGGAR